MKKITVDREKIKTALELLCEKTTSLEKVEKVLGMLPGVDPKTDKIIAKCQELVSKINKISGGEVAILSAENLSEKTKKQKQRKKLILLLLINWKNLGSEVARINDLLSTAGTTATTGVKTAKILATLKGPLGVVTIGAAVIVAGSKLLSNMAVEVKVSNVGCRPIGPFLEREVNIPGLKLPNKAIGQGDEGTIALPPIKLKVNLNKNNSQISTIGFSRQFNLPYEYQQIVYDGQELMGKETVIDLSKSKEHQLTIKCL